MKDEKPEDSNLKSYPWLNPVQPGEVRNPEGWNQYTSPNSKRNRRNQAKYTSELPPIEVAEKPFKVANLKKRDDVITYWERQSPELLQYLFNRANMYLVYSQNGYEDPLGEFCFELLAKQLVKDVQKDAQRKRKKDAESKAAGAGLSNESGGVKELRSKLEKMRAEASGVIDDAEIIDEDLDITSPPAPSEGLGEGLGLGSIPDEF
jgi:hypothetical protein